MEQNLPLNDSWSLMAKVLASEASEAEERHLQQWLEEDASHREQYEQARQLWRLEKAPQKTQPDTDRAWHAVAARMPAQKRSMVRPMAYLTAVAAAVVLLVLWKPWDTQPSLKTLHTEAQELAQLSLNDGSEVWLNGRTDLLYPESLSGNERRIRLKGEAFFEVARDENRPFIIEAGASRVQVLGTSFNVRAYPGEDKIELSVKSGKVLFFKGDKLLADSSNALILLAGQQAQISDKLPQPELKESPQPNYLAWKNRELTFNHARLTEVLDALSRYYGVTFTLENTSIDKMMFHSDSVYKNVPLESILEEIEIANQQQIKFVKTKNGFLVK